MIRFESVETIRIEKEKNRNSSLFFLSFLLHSVALCGREAVPSISLSHQSCYYLKALVRFHVRVSLIEGNARESEDHEDTNNNKNAKKSKGKQQQPTKQS